MNGAVQTVCHIITKLELGGAQQNTLFTLSHLDPSRFRAVLITGEPGMLDQEAEALPGVDFHQVLTMVRPLRPWRDLRALVSLTLLLRTLKPVIVHTHSSKAGVLGRLAAWFAGVPIIIHTIHGFGLTPHQHPLIRHALLAVEVALARLGLSSRTRLTGWRRDVPEIMRCLDVFVLTSLWEGLPRVYLEALASGVPVVGTRVDGAAEVVRDGLTGFLTEPGDVRALAERVLYVLAHPEEANRMGRNGQALPLEFDIHEMVRKQECEYDRLLASLLGKREYRKPCKSPYLT